MITQHRAAMLIQAVAQHVRPLNRPEVAEVFHRAGRIATISAHAATRRRCRAAVLNTIRQPQDAAYNLRFVRLIDELAPTHFALLGIARRPASKRCICGQGAERHDRQHVWPGR